MKYSLKVDWTGRQITAVLAALNLHNLTVSPMFLRSARDQLTAYGLEDPEYGVTVKLSLTQPELDGLETALVQAQALSPNDASELVTVAHEIHEYRAAARSALLSDQQEA